MIHNLSKNRAYRLPFFKIIKINLIVVEIM